MNKKFVALWGTLGIGLLLLAAPKPARCDRYEDDRERFGRLNFHRSILEADVVVSGMVKFVAGDADNNRFVLQVLKPQVLAGTATFDVARELGGAKAADPAQALLVLDPKGYGSDTSLVQTDTPNLLFLKRTTGPDLAPRFGLEPATPLYEVCSGWQSAIDLSLDPRDRATKLLRERYHLTSGAALLPIIQDLTSWQGVPTRDEQVARLLQLLKSHQDSAIYTDNVPPLLAGVPVPPVVPILVGAPRTDPATPASRE